MPFPCPVPSITLSIQSYLPSFCTILNLWVDLGRDLDLLSKSIFSGKPKFYQRSATLAFLNGQLSRSKKISSGMRCNEEKENSFLHIQLGWIATQGQGTSGVGSLLWRSAVGEARDWERQGKSLDLDIWSTEKVGRGTACLKGISQATPTMT